MSWISEFGAAITGRFVARPDLAPALEGSATTGLAVESAPLPETLSPEERATRIRDRYVSTRFPGFPRRWSDLGDVPAVLKAVRIYLEGGKCDRAQELLELASETNGTDELWVARHEVAFLLRDRAAFVRAAVRFRKRRPDSPHWAHVQELARSLDVHEPPFEARPRRTGAPPLMALRSGSLDTAGTVLGLRLSMLGPPPEVGPPQRGEVAA
jgi:hypothetical protein